jgi:hypothetical protein
VVCSLPASASTTLFSDLGSGSSVYDPSESYDVSGLGAVGGLIGEYYSASQFAVAGVGGFSLDEIDLAMSNLSLPSTFFASIWTDADGGPGAQLGGAYWNESTPFEDGTCCGLVSISGITGVSLTGGQSYFLVVGPQSPTDDSSNLFDFNSQGVIGDEQYSNDGGDTWTDRGSVTLPAFDILGDPETASTPEPGLMPVLLFGIGLAGAVAAYRRRSQRSR